MNDPDKSKTATPWKEWRFGVNYLVAMLRSEAHLRKHSAHLAQSIGGFISGGAAASQSTLETFPSKPIATKPLNAEHGSDEAPVHVETSFSPGAMS